jgi:hypothetical protein
MTIARGVHTSRLEMADRDEILGQMELRAGDDFDCRSREKKFDESNRMIELPDL